MQWKDEQPPTSARWNNDRHVYPLKKLCITGRKSLESLKRFGVVF